MKASELRELTGEELLERQRERQNDLINFRMEFVTGVMDNNKAIREARRDIARIKTILREREIAGARAAASTEGTPQA